MTTTPIVNDLDVDLPNAAKRPKEPKSTVHYVTVESTGRMVLDHHDVDLVSLREELINMRLAEPELNIMIRGSGKANTGNR